MVSLLHRATITSGQRISMKCRIARGFLWGDSVRQSSTSAANKETSAVAYVRAVRPARHVAFYVVQLNVDSIVFTRWRHCAPPWFAGPTTVCS